MGEDRIFQRSKSLSPEDRLTFDRWLKGNAIVGLILAAGLIAMAIAGSISGSHEPILADGKNPPAHVTTAHK
jgi:hypothetical protein